MGVEPTMTESKSVAFTTWRYPNKRSAGLDSNPQTTVSKTACYANSRTDREETIEKTGLEPVRLSPGDFKSPMSTKFHHSPTYKLRPSLSLSPDIFQNNNSEFL